MRNYKFFGIACLMLFLFKCSEEEIVSEQDYGKTTQISTAYAKRAGLKPIGSGVMMQAFYWDVPAGGT
jgi:alpha-amylase